MGLLKTEKFELRLGNWNGDSDRIVDKLKRRAGFFGRVTRKDSRRLIK